MSPLHLYVYAEAHDIEIDWWPMSIAETASVRFSCGTCAIAVNPDKFESTANENVKLAHEIGHCETGSFYNRCTPLDVRQKHENRADKWAIKKLVPKDELYAAFQRGETELWELSETFDVTEDFMKKAADLYRQEYLQWTNLVYSIC